MRKSPGAERTSRRIQFLDQGSGSSAILAVLVQFEMTTRGRVEYYAVRNFVASESRGILDRKGLILRQVVGHRDGRSGSRIVYGHEVAGPIP